MSESDTRDGFKEVIRKCRRSQYDGVADVLEHYESHGHNQFGPTYDLMDAPTDDIEMAKRLLWAFKAGRAVGPDTEDKHRYE